MGSAGIMERSALSTSNDINFGNKKAGGAGSSGQTAVTMGSHGIMQRGGLNVAGGATEDRVCGAIRSIPSTKYTCTRTLKRVPLLVEACLARHAPRGLVRLGFELPLLR